MRCRKRARAGRRAFGYADAARELWCWRSRARQCHDVREPNSLGIRESEPESLRAARTRRAQACCARRVTGGTRDECAERAAVAAHRRRANGVRAESTGKACCSAISVSRAAVPTYTWQRRMRRLIAVSLRRWSGNKKRSPSVGRQGLRNRLHPRARNTRRRNYNRASGVMRGGCRACFRTHGVPHPPNRRASRSQKTVPQKRSASAGASRRPSRLAASAARRADPGFALRADAAGAYVNCTATPGARQPQARDACAVAASAISGATPDMRLASVVATVLA